MNDDRAVTIGVVALMTTVLIFIDFWQMRELTRQAQEIRRLRRFLSDRQRDLAEARDEAREAQRQAMQARCLHDQAAAQRDAIAIDLAHLRDRYIDQAGAYRHLLISRLAEGLRSIKFGVN